jgi:hypothetical protein
VATFVLCGNAPTCCKVPQADFAFGCGAIEPAQKAEGREDEFWHAAEQELRNEDKSSRSQNL